MKRLKQLILICLVVTFSSAAIGQSRYVAGVVTSNLDGSPIPEVTVRVAGAINAVQTDNAGEYRIEVPANSSEKLTFSHDYFDNTELSVADKTELNVELISNARFNQYGVLVDRKPSATEFRDGILVFESQDLENKLWFDFRFQADGAYLWGETYRDENNPIASGVELRRVRVAFKAELMRNWEAEIDLDFVDGYADVKDVLIRYNFSDNAYIRAGNFKETFSMETNTTSRYLPFMERPIGTRILTPSRHLGVQAGTRLGPILAIGGVHFQDIGDWEVVEWRKTRNRDFGVNEGYSFTGKLVFMPFLSDLNKGLHFGLAGSYRTPKLSDEGINSQNRAVIVRFDERSYPSINRKKYLDVRMMVEDYTLANLEFAGYLKGLRFQSEYTMASINRIEDKGTEKFNSVYVMGTYLLFGGKQQYNKFEGEFTRPNMGKSWGDVELSLRYENIDLNSREGSMWGMAEAWTAGINIWAKRNVRFLLNYRFVNHDRYANGGNNADTGSVSRPAFVGTDVFGNLTTNPKQVTQAAGLGGKDYQAISLRIDVAF
jgi:phosphate-selective porin OprO and OprP